jgi:hypothetical protein
VCLSRLAWILWLLGRPREAAEARDAALSLAFELDHPFSRCYASIYGAIVSQELDDEPARARLVEDAEAVATDERFELFRVWASALRLWLLACRGDRQALDAMAMAIDGLEKSRSLVLIGYLRLLLARAFLAVGEPRHGLEAVTTALAETERTGAR